MSDNLFRRKLLIWGFLFSMVLSAPLAFASKTQGTIDGTFKYAWGENIGWLNFACDNCNVHITDAGLSGYAWSRQFGWINLKPPTSGVKNDAKGTLSGFAWSSNLGWINFDGVTINSSGEFSGYATVKSDNSKINFNCAETIDSCASANFKVKTDWRPASVRHNIISSGGYSPPPSSPPSLPPPPILPPVITPPTNPVVNVASNIGKAVASVSNSALDFFLNFFRPKNKPIEPKVLVQIPQNAPLSLNGQWNLLPEKSIQTFVFAPLPYEIRVLASKFPELDRTLKSVGVERFTDMSKLVGVNFNIPNLAEQLNNTINNVGLKKLSDINKLNGVALNTSGISNVTLLENTLNNLGVKDINDLDKLNGVNIGVPGVSNTELKKILADLGVQKISDIGKLKNVALNVPGLSGLGSIGGNMINNLDAGKIALIKGLPLAKFSAIAKKNLPSEFVFARADNELVDLNVAMSIGDNGAVTQQIATLPGKTLRLVVKPISRARSVTGYFVFKSATPRISINNQIEIPRSSLTASALSGMNDLVESVPTPIPVENKLVLSTFEYTDPDHDGIYTADVVSPVVPGEYEVITIIDYLDPVLGSRRMSMIAVVDPEGYVFEKNNGKETRIPSAIVSLYYLNNATKKYELWSAKDYQQENPQVTDVRGTYSFLVPEGSYYFSVEAPGYESYNGKVFVVTEGSGIHQNIELKSGNGWLSTLDWKTILLVVVLLLLVYNLFKDKLLKFLNKHDR